MFVNISAVAHDIPPTVRSMDVLRVILHLYPPLTMVMAAAFIVEMMYVKIMFAMVMVCVGIVFMGMYCIGRVGIMDVNCVSVLVTAISRIMVIGCIIIIIVSMVFAVVNRLFLISSIFIVVSAMVLLVCIGGAPTLMLSTSIWFIILMVWLPVSSAMSLKDFSMSNPRFIQLMACCIPFFSGPRCMFFVYSRAAFGFSVVARFSPRVFISVG